jgi:hypothetical protein
MPGCEAIVPHLNGYVDGELPAELRATVHGHLGGCASCRGIVADLTRLREAARSLGPIEPPSHVWLEVAGQIRLADRETPATRPLIRRVSPRSAMVQWIGLAAALVFVTLLVYVVRGPQPSPASTNAGAAGNAATSGSVEAVTAELTLAMQHYQNAISELETIAKTGNGDLDPAVAATVQRNLGVIDQAIAESRDALTTDPASAPARSSLFEALHRKVVLLQTTVALIREMSQGDQSGAARVAGVGKKS